jgi:hypothetical protein
MFSNPVEMCRIVVSFICARPLCHRLKEERDRGPKGAGGREGGRGQPGGGGSGGVVQSMGKMMKPKGFESKAMLHNLLITRLMHGTSIIAKAS